MNNYQIKEIAIHSRNWAEDYQLKHPRHFSECLGSMCAIASSYLSLQLTKNNIEHKIALCDTDRVIHCFVLCGNYVVDITATQFGFNSHSVEIQEISQIDLNETPFWKISTLFNNPSELLSYQKINNWDDVQMIDKCKELHTFIKESNTIKQSKRKM